MIRCSEPALDRCLGWNASLNSVQCGAGYLQSSVGCGGCNDGWYPEFDGTCTRCPPDATAQTALTACLLVVSIILVSLCVVALTIVAVAQFGGESGKFLSGAYSDMFDFIVW